jgi:hypothetical protein
MQKKFFEQENEKFLVSVGTFYVHELFTDSSSRRSSCDAIPFRTQQLFRQQRASRTKGSSQCCSTTR